MTLLVMTLVPNALIMVSDQRLTDARTGCPVTDRANKAVVDLRSRTIFGYTGIAQVGRMPTDEWLMSVMARGRTPTDTLTRLRDCATRTFAGLPHARPVKRLAVVGIGWAGFASGTGEIEPFLVRVSNFDGGDRWLPEAQDRFTLRWFRPLRAAGLTPSESDRALDVRTAGQDIPSERLTSMSRLLVRALERTGSVPAAARLVAEEVRSFAKVNPAVGRGLLVVTVPKPTPGQQGGISTPLPPVAPKSLVDHFAGRVAADQITFLYVPPDASAPAASYAPLILDEGIQFKGGEIWAERPPWWT